MSFSQSKSNSDISNLVNMDSSISRGPQPRYSKKGRENSKSLTNISMNSSKLKSTSLSINLNISKTPNKDGLRKKKRLRTPLRCTKSPGILTPYAGDRFIASRSATNWEMAHFLVNRKEDPNVSPATRQKQLAMFEALSGTNLENHRILAFQHKAPLPADGYQNPHKVLYSQKQTPTPLKNKPRYIPQAPDRVLDAPDIIDDYYLNLVDWSKNNTLAVALGGSVYLWNAATGTIEQLLEMEGNDYVCSVGWIQDGDNLAVGTCDGTIELWDCARSKRLRIMDGHSARVGALAWNSFVLSSGSRSGQIIHHDVRIRDHQLATVTGHNQEVCGLSWANDGKYLASGGNDNLLNIWAASHGTLISQPRPLYTLNTHSAAVKALAFCPWQPHILASGGGTADRHIRFWNCHTGACINAIDTKSQVCALLWSSMYKELVSAHGFANNQLTIWKYPSMTKVTELTGHTARILSLSLSPDGTTVLSAGADETLRLWKCFVKPKGKGNAPITKAKPSVFRQTIR